MRENEGATGARFDGEGVEGGRARGGEEKGGTAVGEGVVEVDLGWWGGGVVGRAGGREGEGRAGVSKEGGEGDGRARERTYEESQSRPLRLVRRGRIIEVFPLPIIHHRGQVRSGQRGGGVL